MCSITFENCCTVYNYYVCGYTHSNCMVVVARAAVAGDPTGACWGPHWAMPTPAGVNHGSRGSLRPLLPSQPSPPRPPHPPYITGSVGCPGAGPLDTPPRPGCHAWGLLGTPYIRPSVGGGAEAPEGKPRRAPLPSATLPLNRPPLGPVCIGEPLGIPADPSPPQIQFLGLAGDPIGLCLSQGRGKEGPGSFSAVCHPPSQPIEVAVASHATGAGCRRTIPRPGSSFRGLLGTP